MFRNLIILSMNPEEYLHELKNDIPSNGIYLMLYVNEQRWTWATFAPKTDDIRKPLGRILRGLGAVLFKFGIIMRREDTHE